MGLTYTDGSEFTLPSEGWAVEAVAEITDTGYHPAIAIFAYADEACVGYERIGDRTYATDSEACAVAQRQLDAWVNGRNADV